MPRALIPMITLAGLLAGCYRYVPARMGAIPAGTAVRLHLSDEGVQRLEGFTASRRDQISGELIRWADEVMVAVRVPAAEGVVDRDLRHRVVVPADEVVSIEVRERDQTRTAVLIGGAAAIVTTALVAVFSGTFGGSERSGSPPMKEEGSVLPAWLKVFR